MTNVLKRWAPALLMMVIIFGFSSIPSQNIPSFGNLDFSIKKFSHAIGYALLALAYLRGLRSTDKNLRAKNVGKGRFTIYTLPSLMIKYPSFFAWLMAILFSATDEIHQSFIPGRNPSIWDVFLFDNFGAIFGLWIYNLLKKITKH